MPRSRLTSPRWPPPHQPAAHEPDLASSLNNLPIRLAAAGRPRAVAEQPLTPAGRRQPEESERASQEAVELDTHGAQ